MLLFWVKMGLVSPSMDMSNFSRTVSPAFSEERRVWAVEPLTANPTSFAEER